MDFVAHTKALIVGSGGNGISPAVYFKRAGIDDFLIISKHSDFGGTWFQNTYPGCEVDVPSELYQLSYAVTGDWSAVYARQPELLTYLQKVAADNDLYRHAHFGTEMTGADWLGGENCWEVRTTQGTYHADFLLLATGYLEEAVLPRIPGRDAFEGRLFHSSQWPDGYTGEGEHVAVIGTGSSGMQIVSELQKHACAVTVFQRTPTWVLPKRNEKLALEDHERVHEAAAAAAAHRGETFSRREKAWSDVITGQGLAKNEELAREFLEAQVGDPELRALLTPRHRFGCKRTLYSDDYFTALQQPNVRIVPEAAVGIGASTITAASGAEIEADTIVFATGFHFGGHVLARVKRRDGRTVAEVQAGHPQAYKSVSVAGCPNLFLIGGPAPNGQIWHGMFAGEATARYLLAAFDFMAENGVLALEVDEAAEAGWKRRADAILDNGPVVAGGCTNYSQDELGHNKAAWPGSVRDMAEALSTFDASAYRVVARSAAPAT
ncbi:flavin-containing monooxygenase [Amycolatopsis sp. NPDC051903]|uniref:flavin-containing monooxygenase n=1 Tax=Amycolatopsis sp. NPDC051903 TaxID=3363936 RepID=UPI0037BCB274